MRYGVHLPQFEHFGDVRVLARLAQQAEQAGWDGFYIWDHVLFDDLQRPMVDPWVALAAIAMSTERIRLGTMVTPLARRRPWKVARETVSLDQLSNGRLTLAVGLGDPVEWDFGFFGEATDLQVRAQRLDEGLDVLTGLWSGEPFSYQGLHYQLREMTFLPRPVQRPRIPIWVGGYWPNKAPMRRAARWDGVCPGGLKGPLTPDDWREILAYVKAHRNSDAPFDAVHFGTTPGNHPARGAEIVGHYAQAGVTWWIEIISPYDRGLDWSDEWTPEIVKRMQERIRQGPPKV